MRSAEEQTTFYNACDRERERASERACNSETEIIIFSARRVRVTVARKGCVVGPQGRVLVRFSIAIISAARNRVCAGVRALVLNWVNY